MTDVSVTLRLPCLCPSEGHKHGVSIQSSINLGDTLPRITREWKTAESWILPRLFIYQLSNASKILDFIHWMVTVLLLIAWLVKTENFVPRCFDETACWMFKCSLKIVLRYSGYQSHATSSPGSKGVLFDRNSIHRTIAQGALTSV